jgi:hypothetical protein
MMDVPKTILEGLESCPPPRPDDRWQYAYELIIGAAASLLSAYPHYVGTSHYGHKERYHNQPGLLPGLLRKAHEEATLNKRPLNLYFDGLEDWTAGYFFNSGIVRIACGFEYTICTARNKDPFDTAKFEEDCNLLKQHRHPAAIEQLLEIIKCFRIRGGADARKQLNDNVSTLVNQFHFKEQAIAETIYEELVNTDDFVRIAVLFVWVDYNWFKHRPMGYSRMGQARERPAVQYALALRGYRALCDLYSWCRTLEQNSAQANPAK